MTFWIKPFKKAPSRLSISQIRNLPTPAAMKSQEPHPPSSKRKTFAEKVVNL